MRTFVKLFERYFLKLRYVVHYRLTDPKPPNQVIAISLEDIDEPLPYDIDVGKLPELIRRRSGNPAWRLYIYVIDGAILGYSFLHVPSRIEWNDSLPTMPKEARTTSTYVSPASRGKGVRGLILEGQSSDAIQEGLTLWSVIEKSNRSSLRAATKSGAYVVRCNILVKFLGRNVLSILTNPFQCHFLLGFLRAQV